MRVAALHVYPVKSAAGSDVAEACVQPWGLDHDRRWMVVDEAGTTVTARTHRSMLHVEPVPQPDGSLRLTAPRRAPLVVPAPVSGDKVPLTLSRIPWGHAAGPDADRWLSDHLGEPVRLVWLDDPGRRTVGESHGGEPGDSISFADAGPILVTTTRSLAQLNDWVAATASDRGEPTPDPLPMVRFRPNIVVDGSDEPFAEDEWQRIRVGEVEMRFAEHCDRCLFPTIDPVTLTSTKEPTRTLAQHRQWDHAVYFGVRMIPVGTGVIRLGDEISVSSR